MSKAHSSPNDADGSLLGSVVTTLASLASLGIQNCSSGISLSIEDDITLKPEWTEDYEANCANDNICPET